MHKNCYMFHLWSNSNAIPSIYFSHSYLFLTLEFSVGFSQQPSLIARRAASYLDDKLQGVLGYHGTTLTRELDCFQTRIKKSMKKGITPFYLRNLSNSMQKLGILSRHFHLKNSEKIINVVKQLYLNKML